MKFKGKSDCEFGGNPTRRGNFDAQNMRTTVARLTYLVDDHFGGVRRVTSAKKRWTTKGRETVSNGLFSCGLERGVKKKTARNEGKNKS